MLYPATGGADDPRQPHSLASVDGRAGDIGTNGPSTYRRSAYCHTYAGASHHRPDSGSNRHADDRADERPNLNTDDRPNGSTDHSPNPRGNLCSHGGSAYGLIFRRIVWQD